MLLYIYNMLMVVLCMAQSIVNKEQTGLFWVASVIGKVMS